MFRTTKWIALLGLAAGAAVFAGCPEDVEDAEGSSACVGDEDCPEEGQICCDDGSCGWSLEDCLPAGGSGGGGSGGCEAGEGCGDPCPEGEGLSASDDLCHADCADIADCYDLMAYCASDNLCYDAPTGADCARAASAPAMDASGPLLFDGGQDTIGDAGALCAKEAACTNNGNVCQFSFQFYDPDGDVAETGVALYDTLKFIDASGNLIAPYDVPRINGATISFKGCYDESDPTVAAAAQLQDAAGHNSNAICFEGSTP